MPDPMKTSFQENRDKNALKSPGFMVLDPKKVAMTIEAMIRRHKKKVTLPLWMMMALKIRYI